MIRLQRSAVLLFLLFLMSGWLSHSQVNSAEERIIVDANAPTRPFAHIWEQMFGSGRAVLTLRASYIADLEAV